MSAQNERCDGNVADRAFSRCHCLYLLSSVTGNALEEDVQAFILAGAHEVLTKPVSRAKLEAALGRYCPNQPTPAAASNSSHGL
jgi:CheY-like chemotaxis protein